MPLFLRYKTILDKAGIFLKFSSKEKDKEDSDDSIMVDENTSRRRNRRNKYPGLQMATKNLASKNCMRSWTRPLPVKTTKKPLNLGMKSPNAK